MYDFRDIFSMFKSPETPNYPFSPIVDRSLVRHDGKAMKGTGWLGILKNANGHDVTEYAVSGNILGKEMDYPTVVPTLSQQELQQLLAASASGKPLPPEVLHKAKAHAEQQVKAGKPVWANSNTYFGE